MDDLKAAWSSAYINALPDSAFACVDSEGRHYPHHDASGKVDLPHLRNAMSRVHQSGNTSCGIAHLEAHAKTMMKTEPIKAVQLGTNKWRVLSVPFGGPMKGGKDLDGEFFSVRTDIKPDWFDRRPVIWHHNLDQMMKADSTIGTADDLDLEEDLGWWSTVWLDRSHRYWSEVDALLQAGKLYGSTGTLPNFVRTDRKTGEILVWPIVEQTLTPIPSNFLSQVAPAKAVTHFDEAGIGLSPALRGLLSDLDASADLRPDLPPGGEDAAKLRARGLAAASAAAANARIYKALR